ncbi:MAG: HDOD domain-containing protein [Candidatus Schekmanbacteria bacterium]|nr:HDOD domain-containing protein [Candidatus Schekmanbacteria bacterium]
MRKVSGNLGLMSLPDVLQWVDFGQKSGTLTVTDGQTTRRVFFQRGKVIFASSDRRGERLGEFLQQLGRLTIQDFVRAAGQSQRLGLPFTSYLITAGILDKAALADSLERLAETIVRETLQWSDGEFEFTDAVPTAVLHGPVMLDTNLIMFQSVKRVDEARASEEQVGQATSAVIEKVVGEIEAGAIELPSLPSLLRKLRTAVEEEQKSFDGIAKIVMVDQVLTSKILKIVNSAYYRTGSPVTSVQHAIFVLGVKSLTNIATAHVLADMSPKNAKRVLPLVRHSLLVAFLARKLARHTHVDPEDAFVCGLLHDIGKTVLVDYLAETRLDAGAQDKLMSDHHVSIGALVAVQWNLSDAVSRCISYHHRPLEAPDSQPIVMTVSSANELANGIPDRDLMTALVVELKLDAEVLGTLQTDIEGMRELVRSLC